VAIQILEGTAQALMNRLQALLKAGEPPWMGMYLRVLAVVYLAASGLNFANLLGYGVLPLEEITAAGKTSNIIFSQVFAVSAVGLWTRRGWGIILFFLTAISQLVLYWGYPELIATSDEHLQTLQGVINFHISTLAIFVILRMQGR